MRLSKFLAIGMVVVSAIAASSSAFAGSRDRHPDNGDELIGYVDGNRSGNGAQVASNLIGIAASASGVNIPGLGNQMGNRHREPVYQEYGGYNRDAGAPAMDFYAECRNRRGQIDQRCMQVVNAKISSAAVASGETFICADGYGKAFRTQQYRQGCRLESKLNQY